MEQAPANPAKAVNVGDSLIEDYETQYPLTDFSGVSAAWLFRFAHEHAGGDGDYGVFCLDRGWLSRHWEDGAALKEPPYMYSDMAIKRAILGVKAEASYEYGDTDKLKAWLERNAHREDLDAPFPERPTTGNICFNVVRPATATDESTYAKTQIPAYAKGKVTHFVSHSWSYAFWSLVEGIVAHQLDLDRGPLYTCSKEDIQRMLDEKVASGTANYYWLDIFNKNQYAINGDDTARELAACIKVPGRLLVVLHPDDRWALARVWCLFEIMSGLSTGAALEVSFSFRMMDVIEDERVGDQVTGADQGPIWYDMDRYPAFQGLTVKTAEATVASDKEYIFKQIEHGIGFDKMDADVEAAVRSSVFTTTLKVGLGGVDGGGDPVSHAAGVVATDKNIAVGSRVARNPALEGEEDDIYPPAEGRGTVVGFTDGDKAVHGEIGSNGEFACLAAVVWDGQASSQEYRIGFGGEFCLILAE